MSWASTGPEARRLIATGLDKSRSRADKVLQLEFERLDRVLSGIYDKTLAGDDQAIERLLRIAEGRTKFLDSMHHRGRR